MSNLALETLLKKREQLQKERMAFLERTGNEIRELDDAIKQLNGGNYIFRLPTEIYDDQAYDYIKSSQEEI